MARPYLSVLDPSTIERIDSSFTRMARSFREPDEKRRWRAAGRQDGVGSGTGIRIGVEEGEMEQLGNASRFERRAPGRDGRFKAIAGRLDVVQS